VIASFSKSIAAGPEREMQPIPATFLRGLLLLAFCPHALSGTEEPVRIVGTQPRAPQATSLIEANPGPWGSLEYYRIPLSFPRDNLPLLVLPSKHTEWVSEVGSDPEWIASLLEGGFSDEEIRYFRQDANALDDSEFFRIYPSQKVVFEMPESLRGRLARFLAAVPENHYHRRPFYFDTGNLSRWFERTEVSRTTIFEIAQLAYNTPQGRGFYFSDLPYLLERLDTPEEERELLRALYRSPTLILRLRLEETTDLEAVADYWSSGFKNKDVLPMLLSVVETPGVSRFDVTHLLPAGARRNLNRYPSDFDGAQGRNPDWFWTCYNFFRFTARDVYADSPNRDELIEKEFEPVSTPLGFGDVVLLRSGARLVHGCIYIADDIVYTKNSPDRFTPWVLMRLEDVVAYHDIHGDAALSFRRRLPAVR